MSSTETQKIKIWDLPTRLFHWFLLLSIILAFITVKVGGNLMQYHFYCGYFILVLLIFRVLWGLLGNHYARFTSFLPNPMAALRTFKGESSAQLGHNPLGAFSVYAMLLSLIFQASTGLFSNDDIASEGPLVIKISKEMSDFLTNLHKINEKIIITLIILHILALSYYKLVKKENLIPAMVTGHKEFASSSTSTKLSAQDDARLWLRAIVVFVIAVLIVWFVVNLK